MPANTVATQDTTYNGWANYETWAVGMYLDGNYDGEGTYLAVLDLVRDLVRERNQAAEDGEQPFYASYVADALKDWTTERIGEETDDLANGIAADLLGAALSAVDWHELGEHKVAEVNES